MTFTTPLALLLLFALVPVAWLGLPRLAYRRTRDTASLVLRLVIITLLVLALAGAQISRSADRLAVVFLIDVSDSVGQLAEEGELAFVRDALATMSPDDVAGVVVFGANATVERQLSAVRELPVLRSTPITTNTDLAEAIRLGLALFPPDAARRMVILSDGQPTVGDTDAAAQLAAASNVEISFVPIERVDVPEIQVSEVRVPDQVTAGQSFDLSMIVEADAATPATITVTAAGEIVHRQGVELDAGTNFYTLTLTAGGTGFRDFQVRLDPEGDGTDGFYQNNQLSTFSQIAGPDRVLVIETDAAESQPLVDALTAADLLVDRTAPNDLPIGAAALAQYQAVVLSNVPATRLSPQRMRLLQSYVRDLGGGLVVVGGPDAYGPGGYFQTELEEALPVESRLVDQQRIPQLTIAYVLDRSGSMTAVGPSGVENLELAKEAIMRSIEFLQPTDRAGVVSFDAVGYWIADVQPVLDRVALQQLVGAIRAGGGTDILAGMNTASETMATDPSPRKHIILLTDGGADPTGLIETTEKLFDEYDVTTSVVAIGAPPPDQTFLDDMAQAGEGNYHAVDVVESIPTIFTLETVLATRSYILEETFVPAIDGAAPYRAILDGITSAPPLLGYVATTPKPGVRPILVSSGAYADPILAAWQYGLGRSVAFTSDASGRWAQNWVGGWEAFSSFWAQVVRWTIIEGRGENIETRVVMEGEQARIIVDAFTSDETDPLAQRAFLNGAQLTASVIDPQMGAQTIPLQQVAPGRYEGTFTPQSEGAYFLGVGGTDPNAADALACPPPDPAATAAACAPAFTDRTGWVMSYSPEYNIRTRTARFDTLERVAALTEGRDLSAEPGAVFAHNLLLETARVPLYPWLLLLALLLLPVDIAVRRLIVTHSDLARLRAWLMRGRAQPAAPSSERLAGLMNAKARATDATRDPQPPPPAVPASSDRPAPSVPSAPTTPSAPSAPPSAGGNIAGKLLQRRKDRGG